MNNYELTPRKQVIEKIASRIIVDCGYDSEYPCPHANPTLGYEKCPHDKEVCMWQIEQATEFVNILESSGYRLQAEMPNEQLREEIAKWFYENFYHEYYENEEIVAWEKASETYSKRYCYKAADQILALTNAQKEEAVRKICDAVRACGQDIDEHGEGTDDKSKKVYTIWYISEDRLQDAIKQALKSPNPNTKEE